MNRRHFLSTAGQAGLGVSLSGYVLPSILDFLTTDTNLFFKLSLAQWSLHKAILEEKTLNSLDFPLKARQLGFDAVEYVSQLYPLTPKNELTSLNNIVKELKLRSDAEGVNNVLIMVDNEGELAAGAKAERDEAVAKHSKWVDAAAELGCHSIRVNLFGTDTEHDFYRWMEASVDGLRKLSLYAAKSGVNVIVENHGGLSSDAQKLTDVIKAINQRNCGLLPDFGNFCLKRENNERWGTPCIEEYDRYKGVEEMLPYAYGVSAKSYDFDNKGSETSIDYKKMLQLVKNSGYNEYIGVEYEGSRLNEEQGIAATKALLLKTVSELH